MSTCKNGMGSPAVFLSRDPGERRRKAEEEGRVKQKRERGKEVQEEEEEYQCQHARTLHSRLLALVSTFHMSPVSPSSPSK